MLREQIHTRLETLKSELESGEAELTKVEKHRTYLHETMLRIGGAVQVLEELLAAEQPIEHPEGSDLRKKLAEPAKTRSVSVRTDES
jgi:predicted nuclease with TOPRIM domain